ncbi:hypothetical protein [Ruminococcus sp. Marseille-P6503]|uniref:hypothetical protein n=1 Tax=Ruminococcus sp. Marseille-P6503 TaxID=2364796 RepID=UPI000F53F0C5|nr:hypothetical protein [Ruminococcus sp. Marseille-P6503]
MKNILESETLNADVSVSQIRSVQRKREGREKAARQRKRRRLRKLIGQVLAAALFSIVSVMMIACVVTGAMYLSGGLR